MLSLLIRLAVVAFVAAHPPLAHAAAPTSTVPQQQELTGRAWKWTGTLMNDGSRTTVQEPNRYLLTFLDSGKVAIQADCNRVLGSYATDGNQITITPGPSTLAACPQDSLSALFVNQLTNVSSYFFRQGSLILEIKFDSGSMTFASSGTDLAGTSWNVVNYNNGKQAVVTLHAESKISLNFGTDGRVSGNAGCNQYTGGYQSSNGQLTVSTLATTFKLCHAPGGIMEQEAQYLAALSSAATFELAGDTLTIRNGGGAMQVVAKANLPAGLAGTSWDVININNGREAVVGTIADTQLTISFGQGDRVSGNAGCNTYSGVYESSGNSLRVGGLLATRMACSSPKGVLQQENQFFTALQAAATFELSGRTLTIRDATGAMQVIATAQKASGTEGAISTGRGR